MKCKHVTNNGDCKFYSQLNNTVKCASIKYCEIIRDIQAGAR